MLLKRQKRISEDILLIANDIIRNINWHDKILAKSNIFFTEAISNNTMDVITILFSSLQSSNTQEIYFSLNKAKPLFRRQIAKRIKIKYMPMISFRIDESAAKFNEIKKIIDNK